MRAKRTLGSVVLAKYRQRSVRIPDTLFCFFEGGIDYVAYRGAIDRHLSRALPFPIVCDGKAGVLAAFGRLVGDEGDSLTNCLFFVDRDYDDYLGRAAPTDWRVFITDGYSFECDYAFGQGMKVLVCNVLAVHWDTTEVNNFIQSFEAARAEFVRALTFVLGVSLYCRMQGCKVNFDKTGIEQLFDVDAGGFPTRKHQALHIFLGRSLSAGSIPSLWAARPFIRALQKSPAHLAIRGKYAFAFLRTCVSRLMHALPAQGVEFMRVDVGERNFAQILAGHIELRGLAEFLLKAKPQLSVPC